MNEAAANVAIGTAKQMDTMSDRALFLLSLVILGVIGFWVIRHLVQRDERKSELLVGLFQEANNGRLEVTKSLTENTQMLGRCQGSLDLNSRALDRAAECLEEDRDRGRLDK